MNQEHSDNLLQSQGLVSAVDISYYPMISELNQTFLDQNGEEVDFLDSLIVESGVNTVRLRFGMIQQTTPLHSLRLQSFQGYSSRKG